MWYSDAEYHKLNDWIMFQKEYRDFIDTIVNTTNSRATRLPVSA